MFVATVLLLVCLLWPANAQSNYPNQPYGDQQYNQRNQQFNNGPPYTTTQIQLTNNGYIQPPYKNNGNNQPQYGNNGSNHPQYGNNGSNQFNQPPFNNSYSQSFNNNGNNPQFGNNGQYSNNGQYGSNGQYGNERQYGSNDRQFGNNDRQFGNNGQFSGSNNNNQFGNNNNNQFGPPPFGNPSFGGNQQGDGNCCEDYCYVSDEDPYIYFGTKTAYDSLNIRQGSQHIVPECTPSQIWIIVRQGTSFPKIDRIMTLRNLNKLHDEIARNYEERKTYPERGRLCPQDYDLFRRWRWNETVSESRADSLTGEGIEDLKQLARRLKSKFSQILNVPYDERSYYFQYTNFDKTHDSYQAFIEGLFGSESFRVHANVLNDELLTRADENCRVWNQQNNLNNQYQNQGRYMTKTEYNMFMEKPEYQQMVRDVFRRLGFRYTLNASIINDIYDLCRYEKAWYVQQRSPWCIAFTKNHLKLLEYGEDLKYFYKSGYGNEISSQIGCGPIKDFYDRFARTVNGNNEGNKGSFLFTHSSTFQALLTALGIGKDYSPLTADNYYQQTKRHWRTSLLDPFTANLAVVLYQCRNNEHKVLFLHNEQPVDFPECSVGLCNWSTVQQKFEQISRSCNVNDICNRNSASSQHANIMALVLTLLVYLRS